MISHVHNLEGRDRDFLPAGWWFRHLPMPESARKVLELLWLSAYVLKDKDPRVLVAESQIHDDTNLSTPEIREAIELLGEMQLVEVEEAESGKRASRYRLTAPKVQIVTSWGDPGENTSCPSWSKFLKDREENAG